MARLTLTLDERLLARIRSRAQAQGTSASELVREFLTAYGSSEVPRALAMRTMLGLATPTRVTSWPEQRQEQPELRLIS